MARETIREHGRPWYARRHRLKNNVEPGDQPLVEPGDQPLVAPKYSSRDKDIERLRQIEMLSRQHEQHRLLKEAGKPPQHCLLFKQPKRRQELNKPLPPIPTDNRICCKCKDHFPFHLLSIIEGSPVCGICLLREIYKDFHLLSVQQLKMYDATIKYNKHRNDLF
jgi:hypothetical protein